MPTCSVKVHVKQLTFLCILMIAGSRLSTTFTAKCHRLGYVVVCYVLPATKVWSDNACLLISLWLIAERLEYKTTHSSTDSAAQYSVMGETETLECTKKLISRILSLEHALNILTFAAAILMLTGGDSQPLM